MSGAGGGQMCGQCVECRTSRRRRTTQTAAVVVSNKRRRVAASLSLSQGRSIKIDSVATADIYTCTPRSVTIQPTDAGPAGSPGQRRSTVAGKRPRRAPRTARRARRASIINGGGRGGGRGMRHNRRPPGDVCVARSAHRLVVSSSACQITACRSDAAVTEAKLSLQSPHLCIDPTCITRADTTGTTAGSLHGLPIPLPKYEYTFQIKHTEAILSNGTRKRLWFENTKMLIAV